MKRKYALIITVIVFVAISAIVIVANVYQNKNDEKQGESLASETTNVESSGETTINSTTDSAANTNDTTAATKATNKTTNNTATTKSPTSNTTQSTTKAPTTTTATKAPTTTTTGSSYAQQVIDLVNVQRTQNGLSPLSTNGGISAEALARAQELEGTFSHTRPDGSSFNTALSQYAVPYSGAGENIAYGQSTPEQVMQSWMNSSGHRANILNPNYTTIGVGCYQNAAGVYYWVQTFVY